MQGVPDKLSTIGKSGNTNKERLTIQFKDFLMTVDSQLGLKINFQILCIQPICFSL